MLCASLNKTFSFLPDPKPNLKSNPKVQDWRVSLLKTAILFWDVPSAALNVCCCYYYCYTTTTTTTTTNNDDDDVMMYMGSLCVNVFENVYVGR